jgi:hypothetical protein
MREGERQNEGKEREGREREESDSVRGGERETRMILWRDRKRERERRVIV